MPYPGLQPGECIRQALAEESSHSAEYGVKVGRQQDGGQHLHTYTHTPCACIILELLLPHTSHCSDIHSTGLTFQNLNYIG